MEEKPLILVTNDDGYDAPGIKALARAMENIGEVYTVAPDREKSASSHSGIDWQAHSLNIQERLVPEKKDERIFAVNGTPADCVYIALQRRDLLPGLEPDLLARQPQLVASGINPGPNLGDDVIRSGTVGGAWEAAFHQVPAMAISLVVERPRMLDVVKGKLGFPAEQGTFSVAAAYAEELASYLLHTDVGWRTFLNVNVPAGQPNGKAVTVLGPRPGETPGSAEPAKGLGPAAEVHERYTTDGAAVFNWGLISVTPLRTDATASWALAELADTLPGLSVAAQPLGKR